MLGICDFIADALIQCLTITVYMLYACSILHYHAYLYYTVHVHIQTDLNKETHRLCSSQALEAGLGGWPLSLPEANSLTRNDNHPTFVKKQCGNHGEAII